MSHHPRRTPPVANQVVEPMISSNARYKKRLIDFDTGYHDLEEQHKTWLRHCMTTVCKESGFQVRLYGYASKLGNAAFNKKLGNNRLNSVLDFMRQYDHRSLTSVEQWWDYGSEQSSGGANDNSPEWRAVEVHIFTGNKPPSPPPPHVIPINPHVLRGMKWSVSACFSLMVGAGDFPAQFGVSLFRFRNDETGTERTYAAPMFGFGIDVLALIKWVKALRNMGKLAEGVAQDVIEKILKNPAKLRHPYAFLKEIVKAILMGGSTPLPWQWNSFTSCEVYLPLTFNLLDGKTVANSSANAASYSKAKLWVYGQVWYEDKRGRMFGNRDLLSADTSGWSLQNPIPSASFSGGVLLLL